MTPSMQQLVDLDHSAQQEQVGDGKHAGHAKDHGPLRSEGKAGVTKLSSSLGARTQARPLSTIFETVRTSTCYTQPLSPGSTPPDVDYSTKPDLEQYLSRKPEPRRKVSPSAAWRELGASTYYFVDRETATHNISLVGSQLYSHRISVCTLPTFVGLNAVSYITGHAPAMSADYDEYFTTHVTTDHGASEAVLNSQTSDPSSSNN